MRVYVITCDKYIATVEPFAYLFNKYWDSNQEVILVGFNYPPFPLPPNFGFISLGSEIDYPVTRWSDALLKLLTQITDETFVLLFEDYFLSEPVNVDMVNRLWEFSLHVGNLLKVDLCGDRVGAAGAVDWADWDDITFVRSDPQSQYHMSLMAGIWRRELLAKVLIPGETPWQVELDGTQRLRALGDEVLVLGTRQWPVHIHLFHRGGDPTVKLTEGLRPGDIRLLQDRGWL